MATKPSGHRSKAILMQATSFAKRLVLSVSCAMLAPPAVSEDTGVGPPLVFSVLVPVSRIWTLGDRFAGLRPPPHER
jgi:hypothetical protein